MALQVASWPPDEKLTAGLIHVEKEDGRLAVKTLRDLPGLLREGDLLVLNDAATLPASLRGTTGGGDSVELRLLSEIQDGTWRAVLFGAGDWRDRTEDRGPPPRLVPGDVLRFAPSFRATVSQVSDLSVRLIEIRFSARGGELLQKIYALGRPVQYSYLRAPLPLWEIQSAFASRPWAVEMPSAGASLPLSLLKEIRRCGIRLASLTQACGLSSSGDPVLDKALPLGERYEIPEETVRLIREAREINGRVIAVGTSVMRALEGSFLHHGGFLKAGMGETEFLIGPGYSPKIVQGLLTGLHEVGESHYRLAASLLPDATLREILKIAERAGLKTHEFGDLCLIL